MRLGITTKSNYTQQKGQRQTFGELLKPEGEADQLLKDAIINEKDSIVDQFTAMYNKIKESQSANKFIDIKFIKEVDVDKNTNGAINHIGYELIDKSTNKVFNKIKIICGNFWSSPRISGFESKKAAIGSVLNVAIDSLEWVDQLATHVEKQLARSIF